MDEKLAVSLNQLNINNAFKKQLEKREAAPPVTAQAAVAHVTAAAAPVSGGLDSFCSAWKQYYPRIVSLLGWASWVLPAQAVTVIKALLAVVNNQVIPLVCAPK